MLLNTCRSCRIAVYYFRSQKYDLGDANCWVDDNEKGAVRLPGWWKTAYNVARYEPIITLRDGLNALADHPLIHVCSVAYIDEKVTPGDH